MYFFPPFFFLIKTTVQEFEHGITRSSEMNMLFSKKQIAQKWFLIKICIKIDLKKLI